METEETATRSYKLTTLKMASIVDGEWGNFTFRMLGKEDIPAVCKHLRENFYLDEPVSRKIGQSDLKFDEFDKAASNPLNTSNLSFAAFEKHTGKIAAIRTITCRKRDEGFIPFTFESREMRLALQFFIEVDNKCNVFDTFCVDEYADLRIQSVDRQFRGKGLASEMYKRAFELLRKSGFSVVKSLFTSPYTRRIADKFGFVELARKYFREITDENGELVCPEAGDDEYVAVMALKL